jgi:adenine-specific DNA-methyltransferase
MAKIAEQIISNNEMLKEWTELLSVPIKSKKDLIETTIQGNEWKKLPLDTKYFDENFKFQLLEEISKNNFLDQLIDGLLIKSENWQALNLLQEKYKEAIRCVYIDPPFNSKTSEILYKNNFKHSSWLSLMENRITKSKDLLCEDACYVVAIDENEQERLGILLSQLFPSKQKTCVSIVHNPGGIQGNNFSYCHEYAYFLYPETGRYISLQDREDNPDIRPLRNVSKGDHLRETAANCFYPIIIKDGKIVEFGDVSDDSFHPKSANIARPDGSIEVYPIDPQGNERKWVFARQSVETIRNELSVEYNKQRGIWDIIRKKIAFNYKTVWTDKLYNANIYGSKLLNDILGEERFSFPKSLYNVADCISAATGEYPNALILDFFGGSGTSAHAIMVLNEKDGGSRKFIIVEMADYFYTVLLPRTKKICYSKEWRNGKPIDGKGFGGFLKYHNLEQFEDTLNNVSFVDKDKKVQETLDQIGEFMLRMLEFETKASEARLNVQKFSSPFDYKINITIDGVKKIVPVDLVETFNYLLGLNVEQLISRKDGNREYRVIFGKVDHKSVVVVWRNSKDIDLGRDKEFIEKQILSKGVQDYIFINGDSYIKNARPIEPEFKRLMGA